MPSFSDSQILIFSAILNAAVTWGVISTKLAWLRRDVDRIEKRMQDWENRKFNKVQS